MSDNQGSRTKLDVVQLAKTQSLDIWIALSYLCKSKKGGVQDFICNELYKFGDHIIEFFLPQLCNILLKESEPDSLLKFLMDKCSSIHTALKLFFWLQAAVEDNVYPKQKTNWLWHECEMAAVNSKARSAARINTWSALPSSLPQPSPSESPKKSRHTRSASMPDMTPETLSAILPTPVTPAAPAQTKPVIAVAKSKRLSLTEQEVNENGELIIPETSKSTHELKEIDSAPPSPVPLPKAVLSQSSDDIAALEKQYSDLLDEPMEDKKARHHYFHQQLAFLTALSEVSNELKRMALKTKAENNRELYNLLKTIQNEIVAASLEPNFEQLAAQGKAGAGLYFPLGKTSNERVIRLLPGDSFCLSSRDRVPFMLFVETIVLDEACEAKSFSMGSSSSPSPVISTPQTPVTNREEKKEEGSTTKVDLNDSLAVIAVDSPGLSQLEESPISHPPDTIAEAIEKMMTMNRENLINSQARKSSTEEDWVLMHNYEGEQSTLRLAYPELWVEKEERLRKTSPFGRLPNWKLQSVIVKSGDDLRQEQLAVQLISTFHKIFRKAELPLWLYPYNVIATSSNAGFIETIPDAISLDSLKKRIPNAKTLEDYFVSAYGEKTGIKFLQAQRNFVESLAAYSLVCYLLQIKDRHNGNILLDKDGHVIHIDYGFMMTSSPGSLGFETAPFKLTDEFIKLMGGDMSDMTNYFKLLLIRGFLEVRKHYQKIILLVEMLLPGYKMKCFARRESVIRELKDRFQLQLSDKECVTFIGDMIKESARNWRTGSYDNYQYYLNGILA